MPLPMTFDTTTAAASMVPSRRSRSGGATAGDDGVAGTRPVIARPSFREQLTGHAVLAQTRPLAGAVLDEQLDHGVLELRVLQHLQARGLARVAEIAGEVERAEARAGFEVGALRRPDHLGAELLGVADDAEHGVQLEVRQRAVGAVPDLEGDRRDELVLAVDEAFVEP